MTEKSFFWGGTTVGDATLAPYSDDAFSDFMRKIFTHDRTIEGVLYNSLNALSASGATTPVVVATGYALVDGKLYENDANVNVAVATPVGATRKDLIVARKDFAAQTVRLYKIAGVEGGSVPTPVQTDGTTWDLPLWEVSITTGGAITLTDRRVYLKPSYDEFSFTYVIGDGVSTLATGLKGYVPEWPVDCDVIGWGIVADASGSVVVDVWARAYASGLPTVTQTITASAKPTLSAAQTNRNTSVSTWTRIKRGDTLAFNVDSAATVKQVYVTLRCRKM